MDTPQRNVRALVAEGSGIALDQCILGKRRGAPAPAGLYATALLVLDPAIGSPFEVERRDVNGDVAIVTRVLHRARYSITWYRPGAMAAAYAFVSWVESTPGVMRASDLGLRPLGPFEVRQVNAIVDGGWEERAVVDLLASYYADVVRTVNGIAEVAVDVRGA